ncbi:hypothetical protein D9758_010622 [Tetrapyrgos nigripes]|uniref:Uncharacterized protein n=1 Tax=Tetrapyrgos nigripes TaxID=182062 RepID=A0A8H5D562_9AGAR|nr:hypothetical protein D9758_010622 [Tetrapyrgos nigripes]
MYLSFMIPSSSSRFLDVSRKLSGSFSSPLRPPPPPFNAPDTLAPRYPSHRYSPFLDQLHIIEEDFGEGLLMLFVQKNALSALVKIWLDGGFKGDYDAEVDRLSLDAKSGTGKNGNGEMVELWLRVILGLMSMTTTMMTRRSFWE